MTKCSAHISDTNSSVELMEPLIKYILLHPSPPSHLPPIAAHLHSSLTLLIGRTTPMAPSCLLDLLVRLLPFQPSALVEQLLFVSSCACSLAPRHSQLSLSSRQSKPGSLAFLLLCSLLGIAGCYLCPLTCRIAGLCIDGVCGSEQEKSPGSATAGHCRCHSTGV